MKAKIDAKPLQHEALKGKVDIKWYGHAGFKIQFKDKDDVQRCIYIDIWPDNKECPEAEKKEPPNDCDLALVTHGQIDHSMHTPFLIMGGKKPDRKIVCTTEVGLWYQMFKKVPETFMAKMQRGGTKDFGFAKITMVAADHPSTCAGPQGVSITGGLACGFVIDIAHHGIKLYHMGDTNLFSDMKLINDLYQPDIAFIPCGDLMGMGPREAAYAAKNFLPNVHTFVPMEFSTFTLCTGTTEEFEKQCKEMGLDESKKIVHPKTYNGGYALIASDEQ